LTVPITRPTDYWHQRFMRRADWELEAELEHAFRLELEAEPDGIAAPLWQYYAWQIELELCQRAQKAYRRADAPFEMQALLDTLERSVDLLAVVGARHPDATRRSSGWTSHRVQVRCPFHDDSSPSMTIYVDQQKWWCHACTFGGDAIDFVRRTDRLTFVEACLKLANEFGVDVPKAAMRIRTLDCC
jgi:hypothetical protein